MRPEHHDHVAAVLLGRRLHEAQLRDVLGQPLQQPEPQLGAVLLATAEHDGDLDLVAGPQEPHDVTLLGLVVVRVDLGTKLHLLDDHVRLVPARLTGLLGVLVLELPVVHELADRRTCHRGDLDQVEIGLLGELEGLARGDDADGLAVGSDEPDLGYPDPVVDAQLGADVSSMSFGWPTRGRLVGDDESPRATHGGSMDHTRDARPPGHRTPRLARTGPDDLVLQRSVRVGVSLHLSDPDRSSWDGQDRIGRWQG